MIPIRLYAYAAIALALAGLVWHDHYVSHKLQARNAEIAQAKASLLAEQESRKHERELSAKIDQQLLDANKALDLERAKPLPRLQCRRLPVSTSGMPSAATGPSVDPTATEGHDGQADAADTFDPSTDLLQYAVEAQQNRDSLQACQDFLSSR